MAKYSRPDISASKRAEWKRYPSRVARVGTPYIRDPAGRLESDIPPDAKPRSAQLGGRTRGETLLLLHGGGLHRANPSPGEPPEENGRASSRLPPTRPCATSAAVAPLESTVECRRQSYMCIQLYCMVCACMGVLSMCM
jgi:hypothetical protein